VAVALVFGLVGCGGDGDNSIPGGGSSPEGNGVVWEVNSSPGGNGLVFRDGTVYIAVLTGNTWVTSTTARYATYTATHLYQGYEQFAYSVSGNTLTIEYLGTFTRRTGQTIQFYG